MTAIRNDVIAISQITPHPKNYNQHPDAQLVQLTDSLDAFDQYRSVVVWQQVDGSYVQVAGHGVVLAQQRRGATSVRADILPVDTSPRMIEAILAADNLHSQNSSPDDLLLAELLDSLKDDFDLSSLGTDEEALHQMLNTLGDEVLARDKERLPEPGDAESVEVAARWGIIIECSDENEQLTLLERFQAEDIACRALVL